MAAHLPAGEPGFGAKVAWPPWTCTRFKGRYRDITSLRCRRGGHLGRLGTRDDIILHQQYIADIEAEARQALATTDPTPYFQKYGENVWAGVKGYLDEVTNQIPPTIMAKYTGVLAAADIENLRLDHRVRDHAVHPTRPGS